MNWLFLYLQGQLEHKLEVFIAREEELRSQDLRESGSLFQLPRTAHDTSHKSLYYLMTCLGCWWGGGVGPSDQWHGTVFNAEMLSPGPVHVFIIRVWCALRSIPPNNLGRSNLNKRWCETSNAVVLCISHKCVTAVGPYPAPRPAARCPLPASFFFFI
jgi:hypothetical protein